MDLESTPLLKVTTQKKTKTAPSALYGCQPVVCTCVRGRSGDDEGWGQHRTNTGKDMGVWELQGGREGAKKWVGRTTNSALCPQKSSRYLIHYILIFK